MFFIGRSVLRPVSNKEILEEYILHFLRDRMYYIHVLGLAALGVLRASALNAFANENPSLAAGVFCEGPVLEGDSVHLGGSRDFLGNIDSGVMLLLHHVHAAIGFGEQLLGIP